MKAQPGMKVRTVDDRIKMNQTLATAQVYTMLHGIT